MFNRRDFLKVIGGTAGAVVAGCGGAAENAAPPPPPPQPSNPPPPPASSLQSIEHIIFTMQENRSFDHYFGKMPEYRRMNNIPGADDIDGLPANASNPSRDDPNQLVFAHHMRTQQHENQSPAWNESHRQWNRFDPTSPVGKMNGFVYTAAEFSRGQLGQNDGDLICDVNGVRAMGYYDWTDIPYYYALGSQFAISDRMFSSIPASTLVNRWYFLAGSSFGRVGPFIKGCAHQLGAKTIFDLCEAAGVSWKIYVNGDFTYYAWFAGYNKHKNTSRIVNAEQFFADAASGNLPQVAMIESGVDGGLDEHPKNDIQSGAAYMKRFFDALMKSPLWPKSAMMLTYDEGGAFFDHVPSPPAVKPDDIAPVLHDVCVDPITGEVVTKDWTPGDFNRLGFRVPFTMVSPWVKPHYVSHQVADHTSILKFIEKRFNLPNLTRRDAAAHDLLDMFDFSKPALLTPPSLPQQPTNGAINFCNV